MLSALGLAALGWAAAGVRARFSGWSAWRAAAFATGIAVAVATLASPLDGLGTDGLLTAHVAQHIGLGDLAAPLLVLGFPDPLRHRIRTSLARLAGSARRRATVATGLLSPAGAVVAWSLVTYLWFVPPLHRAAAPRGLVHTLDHLSFLGLGLLIWLPVFDPRITTTVRKGLVRGGLPWWARHVYAMGSRLAMLPPPIAVWLAGPSTFRATSDPLPVGSTPTGDRIGAASLMVGFEMLLFVLAVLLAFIFVSVTTGHERDRA